jgi:subtilisin-like proprotein convertase family protein
LGTIPDATVGGNICGDYGPNKDVTFTVSGQPTGAALSDVRVSMSITHSWVGDLDVRLLGPGGTPSAVIFSNTGSTTATGCGDDSNLSGPYNFFDTAPASPTWWGAAATATTLMPAGDFRVSTPGGVAGGGANALLTPTFAGVTNPNGTWTLRIRDGGEGDTGSVTAASLTLTQSGPPAPTNVPLDFNGDGKSDYVVVRNVGGGANGQIRWFYNINGGGSTVALDWGLASDFFISEDFDNDGKDDVAVWRGGPAGTASFYILNSATSTARVEAFGQTGDDPTVVDDYNGDGAADLAVYREGVSAGDQSTWFYRTAPGGAVTNIPWGINGDVAVPGDMDGNGSADFTIQRANGGGGNFWTRLSTGAVQPVVYFGLASDDIVPGDYDGDLKTDIAAARVNGGSLDWYYRRSTDGAVVGPIPFGTSTDFAVQGDYDGDGKVEPAIWRASVGQFISRNSSNGAASFFSLGSSGDYPVANYNVH